MDRALCAIFILNKPGGLCVTIRNYFSEILKSAQFETSVRMLLNHVMLVTGNRYLKVFEYQSQS